LKLENLNHNGRVSDTVQARVQTAVFRAIDTLNETLAQTQQVAKVRDTVLVDSTGSLDSMAVVNLLVFIEDELAQISTLQLDLTGADAFEQEDLKTLGSVIDVLCRKLGG
jgi:acyl carrier protein